MLSPNPRELDTACTMGQGRAALFGGADPVELNGQWVRTGVDLDDISPNPGRRMEALVPKTRIDFPSRLPEGESALRTGLEEALAKFEAAGK